LSYDQGLQLATDFFQKQVTDTAEFRFSPKNDNHNAARPIYSFRWERADSIYGNEQTVHIEVSGDKITKFKIDFEPKQKPKKSNNFESIPTVILMICIIIFMLILLIQKLRKDRIELKSNIAISVAVALSWVILMIINITRDSGDSNFLLVLILPLLITTPFILFSFIASSSLGESEAREVWPDKLVTMDALRSGIVMFPKLSISLIRGFSLAFILAGTVAVLLKVADLNFNFFIVTENDRLYAKLSHVPLMFVAASGILNVCFGEYVFRLFFLSYFRKIFRSTQIIILISVLLWIFVFGGYLNFKLSSYGLTLAINFVLGLLIVFFFVKGDFLTVLWGGFAYYLLRELYPFFHFSDGPLWWNGIALWIIFAVVFLIAIIGLRKDVDATSFKKYVPEYQKRQQERERILRELEIARNVQASFLPRKKPSIGGIDVASLCIPATEVGGDYFDFIELDDGKLGVVIGDVSGKGISAAFHMTLTKGFLKSQAKTSLSPREVLIHLNELFYENVERGTFISMIYGIFDVNNNKFTFARAGHNPLLLKKCEQNDVEILCPKGLALGLEKGSLFNQLIEEYSVNIHSKDIFMFYTDGFSEAMNNKNEEFGEDRLQILFNNTISLSAESIITEIKSQIFSFVEKAPQHDDMTMIIVKIM
ncbi:MAG: SpoIIE family protein phosphatase, partial [bacterium]|nr:SpoIIE family protein phosphatase [bacterium]